MTVIPIKEALVAFRRDCDEMRLIAMLLRQQFRGALVAPILDVGAGSGELAALAFPDLTATLLDHEPYAQSTNPNHTRMTRDFSGLDPARLNPNTIVFCHTANYFLRGDAEAVGEGLVRSGAKAVLVVSNEAEGTLKDVAAHLRSSGVYIHEPFHVAIPGLSLEKRVPFVARLATADFETMARHVVRIIFDLEDPSLETLVEEQLRSRIGRPELSLAEGIYCYRPP